MVDTDIEQEVFVQVIPMSQKASDALHTQFQMRVFYPTLESVWCHW